MIKYCCSWLLFLGVFIFAGQSQAEIILQAPQKSARGDAFVAEAISTEPVEEFVFFWRGKEHRVRAKQDNQGWSGKILLPAALDEKADSLALGLGSVAKSGGKAIEKTRATVALFDRPRPTQKLTVNKKYVNPPASEKARIESDRQKVRKALATSLPERLWELPFQRPVPGGVSSLFGMKRVFNGEPRSVHRGLDLRGAQGTPIKAVADGEVVLVDNLYFSGNTVYLNHGDGVFSAYLHMSEPKVAPGQKVSRGDVIGLVGATGRVTGPHLHLSLIVQGQSVDPQPLLENTARETKK